MIYLIVTMKPLHPRGEFDTTLNGGFPKVYDGQREDQRLYRRRSDRGGVPSQRL